MPTIFKQNGFRFFFYSNDHLPKHVHTEKSGMTAKFNLNPIELVVSKKVFSHRVAGNSYFDLIEFRNIRNTLDEYFN